MSCSTRCSIARDRSPGTDHLDQHAGLRIRLQFETVEDQEPFAAEVFERHPGSERIDGVGGLNLDDSGAQRTRFGRRRSLETRDRPAVSSTGAANRKQAILPGSRTTATSLKHVSSSPKGIEASGRGLDAGNPDHAEVFRHIEGDAPLRMNASAAPDRAPPGHHAVDRR